MTQRPTHTPPPNTNSTASSAEPAQQKRTLVVLVIGQVFSGAVPALAAALALLGLGWSFGIISGTAKLAAALPLGTRARTQGTVDLWIAVAGAIGGMASGLVVASAGYGTLALVGGLIAAAAILPIIAVTSSRNTSV